MIRALLLSAACVAFAGCFSPVDEMDGGGFGGGGNQSGGGGGNQSGGGGVFGGGAGGGTGGGGSCDGCFAGNVCVPLSRTSPINCGFGGSVCVSCNPGQICSNGLCAGGFGGGAGGGAGGGNGGGIGGGVGGGFFGGGAGGGAGGGFGGGTGGGAPCDGCYFAGACIPRSSSNNNTFCGQGGAICAQCGSGQTCSNYVCQNTGGGGGAGGGAGGGSFGGGAGGGGGVCDGCYLAGPQGFICVPLSQTNSNMCGANGAFCNSCNANQVCSRGLCVGGSGGGAGGGAGGGSFGGGAGGGAFGGGVGGGAFGGGFGGGTGGGGFCDGCFLASGACVPFSQTNQSACGARGSQCTTCFPGQVCNGGICMSPTTVHVGDPCFSTSDCAALGPFARCKRITSSGNATYTNGYCTLSCGATGQQCPIGSTCVNGSVVAPYGESETLCWDNCSQTDQCRSPGYACYGVGNLNACWIAPLPPIGGGAGGGIPVGGGAAGGVPVGGGFGGGTAGGVPVGGGFGGGFGGGTPTGGGFGGGIPSGGGTGGGGTCSGCFFSGFCIDRANSNNDAFCGEGGVTCQSCNNGLTCQNYRCQPGPVGGGGGFPFDGGGFGGGVGGGFPIGGGAGGGFPIGGGAGGGGTIACSAATCSGCCRNNTCVPLNSQNNFNCGARGAQCATCVSGLTCSFGQCVAAPDAGTSQVGNACTTDTQCRPPSNGFCIAETVFGQPTGWPGGACSASCANMSCPAGSSCLDVGSVNGGASNPICFQSCPAPRLGQSTCRQGYVCEVNVNVSGAGICIPRCNTAGFQCWQGTRCDAFSGYCVAGP